MKSNFRTFFTVWAGETVSLLGSSLTGFALGVWAYQHTGSVTQYALIALFAVLPATILSPFAGALIDRWDRRKVMLIADGVAGLSTLTVLFLFMSDKLEVWHLYITAAVAACAAAFQMPAFTAATTLMVPKEDYARASGLRQLGISAAQLIAPLLAGFLIVAIQVPGVIIIDLATFLFAMVILFFVRFPNPAETTESKKGQGSLWHEAAYGWRYINSRPGLLAMLFIFAAVNFALAMISTLFTPMMLTLTTAQWLGIVLTIGGMGMLAGSLVMSIWGGPKRRIHGVLGFQLMAGIAIIIGGLRPSVGLIALAAFAFFFSIPLINASSEAIWQSKVDANVQGRVFAVRNAISLSIAPLAYLIAGPLADKVFNPLLTPEGVLAGNIGQIVGVGEGRGIALIFIIMGFLAIAATLFGYLYPPLYRIEDELPDAIGIEPRTITADVSAD